MTLQAAKVLFVDDDPQMLEVVRQLMGTYAADSWQILTATSSPEALRLLQSTVVDLMVIDIHMPVVDGPQLLKLLQRKYPNLQKVVLTGDTTGAYRAECLSSGAELFLEKPRHPSGWQVIYATLAELARFRPESGFRGVLRQVGLQEVLQMECLSRNSSILQITADSLHGRVYIQDGEVVHAEAGELTGEKAFYRLFGLKGGDFSLLPFVDPPQRTIMGTWESLLMEAAQISDEASGAELAQLGAGTDQPLPPPELERDVIETISGPEVPGAEAGSQAAAAVVVPAGPGKIQEVVVCTALGEVLYDWQCQKLEARVAFLESVSAKSRQLSHRLPCGVFDRLEIDSPQGRTIVQVKPSHTLLVRTSVENPVAGAQAAQSRPVSPR